MPAGLYPAMFKVQTYIDNCGLDLLLLELMKTRVSQINGCAYCLDMHFKEAVEAGESFQRLISVAAWRELLGESNDDIHDELVKHFSKDEIANLTLSVAQINTWNRLVKSFGPTPGNYQPTSKLVEKVDA